MDVPVSDLPDEHRAVPASDLPESPSVMDAPPTVKQRIGSAVKAVAPVVAGAGTALTGARVGGELLGPPGAIGGAVVGGLAAPFVQRGTQAAVTGQPYQGPSRSEVMKSAITNAAFTSAGEIGAAVIGKAQVGDEVRGELMKLPQAERTTAKVKQIQTAIEKRAASTATEATKVSGQNLRNRDFWKAHGLDDGQIDEVLKSPDLQAQLAQSIEAGNKFKAAYQATKDHVVADFHDNRYGPLFKRVEATKMDTAPLGKTMLDSAQGIEQHELSPAFKGWLLRKGAQLDPTTNASNVVASKGIELPDGSMYVPGKATTAPELGNTASKMGAKAEGPMTSEQLQTLRTELHEQVPRGATPLDKKAAKQINDQLTTMIKEPMSPEDRAGLDAIDADYGRYRSAIDTLDPRQEKYAQNVANALFDPIAKDPEMAMNFMSMAKAAEQAQPGKVMPQLREAFMNKALAEAHKPGEPFEELKGLRKLQDQFGGDKNSRAVMGEMFGKDSPLASPATFTKVVEAANNPEPLALAAKTPGWGRTVMSSPYFQGMITFGVLAGLSGTKGGGVFASLTGQKGPEAQALAITAMLVGPPAIGWVIKSGNSPLQRAMVAYVSNPNAANTVRYLGQFVGASGSAMSLPSPEEAAASR
jgi:hypothetical protein